MKPLQSTQSHEWRVLLEKREERLTVLSETSDGTEQSTPQGLFNEKHYKRVCGNQDCCTLTKSIEAAALGWLTDWLVCFPRGTLCLLS